MSSRISVDVGGTFTDVVFYDDQTGELTVGKTPTVSREPERGIIQAIEGSLRSRQVRDAELFMHGTTVGLNALLQQSGAVVGLICTRGFRDVLELRRGDRTEAYDLFWRPAPPIVPRRRRVEVSERVLADGSIAEGITRRDIERAVTVFESEQVDSIAVAFLNAYANPENELEAERILRELGVEWPISLSHRVSGEYREYERTSTTVVDAFVRPVTVGYLQRLAGDLDEVGFRGARLLARSGGGTLDFAEAERKPFETIMSGPVGGAVGAAALADEMGIAEVITADVGGTSFDTCMIIDGRPEVLHEGSIGGYPLQTEWVDVRSVGAGGGSIAYVDRGGLLRVGPTSAGAVPGPACYGRGGLDPTVTDAALALGMFGSGRLAGGLQLSQDLALAALTPLAEELGLSVEALARGIVEIAVAAMAGAIREITIERGRDPGGAALVAFGGAGPLFGALLTRELGIETMVVPPHAGNFSALGLLDAGVVRASSRTCLLRLDESGLRGLEQACVAMFGELEPVADGGAGSQGSEEVAVDLRYVGQEHSLTVPLDWRDGRLDVQPDVVHDEFLRRYRALFGHSMDERVEIITVRAGRRTSLPGRKLAWSGDSSREMSVEPVRAYSFELGEIVDFATVPRLGLGPERTIEGPVIIEEPTTTTYVDFGHIVSIDGSGALVVSRMEQRQ